jgi:hypothetical protein
MNTIDEPTSISKPSYYQRIREARLAYQRKYGAEHKEEKAKRMRTYGHQQRYGENRGYVLIKDTQYRIGKFLKRWAETRPDDTEHSAPEQTLEEFKTCFR